MRSVFLLWDRQGYLASPICSFLFPGSEGRLHSPGQQLTSHMTKLLPMNYEQKCNFHLTHSRETIWTWTLLFSPFLGWMTKVRATLEAMYWRWQNYWQAGFPKDLWGAGPPIHLKHSLQSFTWQRNKHLYSLFHAILENVCYTSLLPLTHSGPKSNTGQYDTLGKSLNPFEPVPPL